MLRRATMIAAAAALTAAWAAQVPGRFTVEVPVLVLDKSGAPMVSLDQDQFRLFDNGRPEAVTRFEHDPRPVSVAVVVDTHDPDALAQAARSATLLTTMVIGDGGAASLYVSGPEPRCVLDFTTDQDRFADALRHLTLSPQAALGQGQITAPAQMALLALAHRPSTESRAVIIVAQRADRSGPAATSLTEASLQNAIAIFRLSPNRPDGANARVNPDSVTEKGTGSGSQRDPDAAAGHAMRGEATGTDQASVNLTPILSTSKRMASDIIAPHDLDYVYDSGGLTLSSSDNVDFDRQLSSIGADLRSFYRLYFQPDDILPGPTRRLRHSLTVTVRRRSGAAAIGNVSYRRAFWGPPAVAPSAHP